MNDGSDSLASLRGAKRELSRQRSNGETGGESGDVRKHVGVLATHAGVGEQCNTRKHRRKVTPPVLPAKVTPTPDESAADGQRRKRRGGRADGAELVGPQ